MALSRDEVFERVKSALGEQLGVDEGEINNEASFQDDLDADSLDLVELIRSVHKEEGKTVLMVEHRMEVVIGLAERIAVMHHGALLAFDEPENVMANETVQTAYLGEPL